MYKYVVTRKISDWEKSSTPAMGIEEMYAFLASKHLYLDLNVLKNGLIDVARKNEENPYSVDIYQQIPTKYLTMKKSSYRKAGLVSVVQVGDNQKPIIEA